MLQVTTPPSSVALTTPAAVNTELGQGISADLAATLIAQASAACEGFCGQSFARAGLSETFFDGSYPLCLARAPIVSVESITEGSTVLDAAAFIFDPAAGIIYRDSGIIYRDWVMGWIDRKIVVAYTAGYLVPDQTGCNLPADIERACLEVVKALWFTSGAGARDPAIRSESVEGIGSTSYLDPQPGAGGLPPLAAALLKPYQR